MNLMATRSTKYMAPADLETPELDRLFIAGSWVTPESSTFVDVVCPSTEEIIARVAEPGKRDADRAIGAARLAFDDGPWPRMTMQERIEICSRFADALEGRLPRLNNAWVWESGAPLSYGEMINDGAGKLAWRLALERAAAIPWEEERRSAGSHVLMVREPIGTILAILTYNGPVVLIGMKVIPALLAGNTVIVKHAPESALTSRIIAEAVAAAGFPEGVISVLPAGTTVTQYMVSSPDIDMISLTGGTAIAVDIVKRTSDRLARTALELGGKSPAIILDDASLDDFLPTLVGGATGFCGQICVTLSRVLVSRQRHDEVVAALSSAYRAIKVGDPWDTETERGPLAVKRARDRSEYYVDSALSQGARIAAGGRRPPHLKRGWYYEPTLLSGVDNSMTVAREEIFGPVTCVISYEDIDDAIRIANDTKFGLSGAVYTSDPDHGLAIARRIRTGGVGINVAGVCLSEPFGGVKQSGWGRECGIEGILEFTNLKQILLSGSSVKG
jgi:aldehyde dehydrogenase (NAD+)